MLCYATTLKPEIEKILRKNQNSFRRDRSTTSQIRTFRRILGVRTKKKKTNKLEATNLICISLQGI